MPTCPDQGRNSPFPYRPRRPAETVLYRLVQERSESQREVLNRAHSALNLNVHFHMLFLDGVYVDGQSGPRFRWVKAPTSAELTQLSHTIAQRVSRFLERQGLLERDADSAFLATDTTDEDPMDTLLRHSVTYRIATGPRQGRKVLTLQTLPAIDEPFTTRAGNVAGFSLHAGSRPRLMSATNSNAFAAISPGPPSPKNASLSPNMARSATPSKHPGATAPRT